MGTLTWSSFFATTKYWQQAILRDTAGAKGPHTGKGPDLLLQNWTRTNFTSAWSREWTIRLSLLKTPTFHFQFYQILNKEVLQCGTRQILSVQTKNKLSSEFLSTRRLRYTQFVLPKSTNPQLQQFGVQENCTELRGTEEVWITLPSKTFFLKMPRIRKRAKKERFSAI